MKPCDINKLPDFIQISYGRNPEISGIYCCDLLSMALGKLKENQILVTVISNINTLAIAYQKKASCIVIAENIPQEATATIIIPVLIPQTPTQQAITDTAVSRITVIAQTQTTAITITTEQTEQTEHMDRIPAAHTAMETIKTITSSRQDITTIPM